MSDAEPTPWKKRTQQQPTDLDRKALQSSLADRARDVRQHGWSEYREVWTNGELAGVAYLLQDTAFLEELEEPEGSVLTRYAGELFGFHGARKDIQAGLVETQAWFAAARTALGPDTSEA